MSLSQRKGNLKQELAVEQESTCIRVLFFIKVISFAFQLFENNLRLIKETREFHFKDVYFQKYK